MDFRPLGVRRRVQERRACFRRAAECHPLTIVRAGQASEPPEDKTSHKTGSTCCLATVAVCREKTVDKNRPFIFVIIVIHPGSVAFLSPHSSASRIIPPQGLFPCTNISSGLSVFY
jgi:hypothetical protein